MEHVQGFEVGSQKSSILSQSLHLGGIDCYRIFKKGLQSHYPKHENISLIPVVPKLFTQHAWEINLVRLRSWIHRSNILPPTAVSPLVCFSKAIGRCSRRRSHKLVLRR